MSSKASVAAFLPAEPRHPVKEIEKMQSVISANILDVVFISIYCILTTDFAFPITFRTHNSLIPSCVRIPESYSSIAVTLRACNGGCWTWTWFGIRFTNWGFPRRNSFFRRFLCTFSDKLYHLFCCFSFLSFCGRNSTYHQK